MTTITIDRSLLEQALDALECCYSQEYDGAKIHGAKASLRAALAAKQPAPAWHDAPTEPGDWILSTACGLEVHQGIKQHELDNGELWPGSRWFGPIPEYQK